MINRVLILGNSGFIGSRLEERFRESNAQFEVIGRSIDDLDMSSLDQVRTIEPFLDRRTLVIMCAAIKREFGDTFENFIKNCTMVANLCTVLEANPIGRLIYFSSTAVYGEDVHNTSLTEATLPSPTSYYGIGKCAAEHLLRKCFASNPKALVLLRPPTIYGPTENRISYSPSGFAKLAMRGETITLWGDGEEMREFIFIDDVVEAVWRIAQSEFGGTLNLASGKSHSFQDILSVLARDFALNPVCQRRERTKAKVDHGFDNTLFRKEFPDFKFTSLLEGIRRAKG